jgi:3-deoxy-D-manno-octulosonic-acid transferase
MRGVYTALWWLASPLLPLRLWWRGRREPGYRLLMGERWGRYAAAAPDGELLWVHAVSLGETRAAAPLVERLLRERPHATVLLTHMTATGREQGRSLAGPRVVQAWLPYDLPYAVRRFLDHFHPSAGFLLETELWPNLIAAARRDAVPVFLVNARLSARSARRYARAPRFMRALLGDLAGIAAQTADDAQRLEALGATGVACTGNLKFDLAVPSGIARAGALLRESIGRERPVWVAASTREGEEALIVDALRDHPAALPQGTVTVIVPRHPQRFDAVARMLRERGVPFVRRSEARMVPATTPVMLGDSMGELLAYYAAADVAFVGGSLLPLGGQNLIEPIAIGTPTLIGPHTFNFAAAAEQAVEGGAALRVADAADLVRVTGALLVDAAARNAVRAQCRSFMSAHRGATDRLWAWLAPRLAGREPRGAGRSACAR